MAAGMGAGIGSIFRAPLAGAMFSAEINVSRCGYRKRCHCSFRHRLDYWICHLFAVSACRIPESALIWQPDGLRDVESVGVDSLGLMALVLSGASWFYVRTFYGTVRLTHHHFHFLHTLKPAIGAGLAALIGIGLYFLFDRNILALGVLATGYGTLEVALSNASTAGISLLCAVAFAKIITTSLTISSGADQVAFFGPSMVIGGCLGAACGLFFHQFFPGNCQTTGTLCDCRDGWFFLQVLPEPPYPQCLWSRRLPAIMACFCPHSGFLRFVSYLAEAGRSTIARSNPGVSHQFISMIGFHRNSRKSLSKISNSRILRFCGR